MLRATSLVLSLSCKVTNLAWVPVFVTSCNLNYLNSHLRVLILEGSISTNLGADFNLLVHTDITTLAKLPGVLEDSDYNSIVRTSVTEKFNSALFSLAQHILSVLL